MPNRVHASVRLADLRRFVAENEPGPQSDTYLAWTALRNVTRYGPDGEHARVMLSTEWELPHDGRHAVSDHDGEGGCDGVGCPSCVAGVVTDGGS